MIQKVFTVPTRMVSAHPEYEISQLEAGRYGSVQDQITAAKDAIQGAINARIWSTVAGAISASDPNYATSSSGLTISALNGAINWVEDQGYGVAAIIGRRNILYRMLDFGTTGTYDTGVFSDSMKDTILKGGKIPFYRGIPVVGLPQWRDGFGKLTIPQDEVLVVGGDCGKYVVSQELASKDAIDVDNLVWHIHLYMRVGCAVFFDKRLYKIKITH